MYIFETPGMTRGDMSRSMVTLSAKPAFESLDDELNQPNYSVRLREAIENGLPETCKTHPIVVENPTELVAPVALYMDFVPYSLVDSVLGVWLVNMVLNTRHMMLAVRKKIVCRCGCKGWCTWFPVLQFIHWVFANLSRGTYPHDRHDGSAFGENDTYFASLAGKPLKMKAALVDLKGDWQEFCERLGFPTWQSGTRPCFCCAASGPGMYDPVGVSFLSNKWYTNTDADYASACDRCERWVEIVDAVQHKMIVDLLPYDKRGDGSKGRALRASFPELGLEVGDR
jgi:hypothetical protein